MNNGLWTASILLIAAGILLLIGGTACQAVLSYRQKEKLSVRAKVVDLVLGPHRGAAGSGGLFANRWYPVFEYYAKGKLYKVTDPHGSWPSRYRVGQEISLDLERSDPSRYEISTDTAKKTAASVLYASGVVCLLAGCVIFVKFALRG